MSAHRFTAITLHKTAVSVYAPNPKSQQLLITPLIPSLRNLQLKWPAASKTLILYWLLYNVVCPESGRRVWENRERAGPLRNLVAHTTRVTPSVSHVRCFLPSLRNIITTTLIIIIIVIVCKGFQLFSFSGYYSYINEIRYVYVGYRLRILIVCSMVIAILSLKEFYNSLSSTQNVW